MTDEEMAEEYYYKTYPVTLNIGEEERKKEVTDIFLAGLKAGRPQWHDLRKAPNDLPEKLELGTCSRTVVNQIGTPCHYDYELQCWRNWCYIQIETPIAWCEIPTFDKE